MLVYWFCLKDNRPVSSIIKFLSCSKLLICETRLSLPHSGGTNVLKYNFRPCYMIFIHLHYIVRCITAAPLVLWIHWQHNVIAVCFGLSYQFGICSKTSKSFAKCLSWTELIHHTRAVCSSSTGSTGVQVYHMFTMVLTSALWLFYDWPEKRCSGAGEGEGANTIYCSNG